MNSLWPRVIPRLFHVISLPRLNKNPMQISSYCSLRATQNIQIKPTTWSYSALRHKSKKRKDYDSDDEQEFDEGDQSLSKDSKVMKLTTTSLRTDAVLKSALGVARNKIEELFYESKIRVNGKKILKKSTPVREDYEIDVIKGLSPKNPDHILVSRVEVLSMTAKEDSIVITVRRFKNLLIENYEKDPYKPSTADSEN
ncbi:mitochondrial transcription rescue factor 1 [Zerene cesonia]|uniref:mitochondrial transcription rescue factor 1 n=1 Tax=Zerene cesonia TaxID=33412 RepID=UPI0018E50FD0|nr:mitochondrial transcription rescue factor 1 [Zerene cesonia]